jgi:hypothetical protein
MRHAHLPLRVQFNRSELLTEVVQDIDIMPVDPYENLPVNIPLVPSSLNGRPRPVQGVARRRVVVRGRAREGSEGLGEVLPASSPRGGCQADDCHCFIYHDTSPFDIE